MASQDSGWSRLGRGISTFAQLFEMGRQAEAERALRREVEQNRLDAAGAADYSARVEAGRPQMGGGYSPGQVAATEADFMGAIPGADTATLRAQYGQVDPLLGPGTETNIIEEGGMPFAVAAPSPTYGAQLASERVRSAIEREAPVAAARERTAAQQAGVDRFNQLVEAYDGDVETARNVFAEESQQFAGVGAAVEGLLGKQEEADEVATWEAAAAVAESKDEEVRDADDKIAIATRDAGRELTPPEIAGIEAAHERMRLIEQQASQAEIDAANAELDQSRFQNTRNLQNDFGGRKEIQQFTEISQRYMGILDAIDRGTGLDEVIIVNNLAKLIDPDSVVREGEFENVLRGMGLYDRILNHLEKMKKGGVIDDAMKEDIKKAAQAVFIRSGQMAQPVVRNFTELSSAFGIDPNMVVSDYVGSLASLGDRGIDMAGLEEYGDLVQKGLIRPPGARR